MLRYQIWMNLLLVLQRHWRGQDFRRSKLRTWSATLAERESHQDMCLASYCETHLRLHNELNAWKAHLLVDVTEGLQTKMCPQHHKLLEVYCRTDRQCICFLCMLDTNHKEHDMVSAATERAEKQVKGG